MQVDNSTSRQSGYGFISLSCHSWLLHGRLWGKGLSTSYPQTAVLVPFYCWHFCHLVTCNREAGDVSWPSEWPSQEYTILHVGEGWPPRFSWHRHIWDTGWIPGSQGLLKTYTQISAWTLDHINVLPTYKLFLQTWCTEPGICVTRKASMLSWNSSRPFSRKMGIDLSRYNMLSTRRLESGGLMTSPPQLLFFHMSRWLMAVSGECWPKTTSRVLACHLGRSPSSSIWWRITWYWGHRRYTAYALSVARCPTDRVVSLLETRIRNITDTCGLDIQTNWQWRNLGLT